MNDGAINTSTRRSSQIWLQMKEESNFFEVMQYFATY
jgi:hypothetical protein